MKRARRTSVVVAMALVVAVTAGIGPSAAASPLDVIDFSPPRDHIAQCLPTLRPRASHDGLVMGISPVTATPGSADVLGPMLATAPHGMTIQLWAHYRSADPETLRDTVAQLEREVAFWTARGYRLTLTIPYRTTEPLVDGYERFVATVLAHVGSRLERVYVTNEANFPAGALDTSDGSAPGVVDALVAGVIAAHDTAATRHLRIQIGFKVLASIHDDRFWTALARRATDRFRRAIDLVGVDLYPTPLTAQPDLDVAGFVVGNLALLRGCRLPSVGLDHAAFDVTEAGASHFWFRPPVQQAAVLRTMIHTAYEYSGALDIVGWTQWGLACDPRGTDIPGDFLGCTGIVDSVTGARLPGFDVFATAAATNGAFGVRETCPVPACREGDEHERHRERTRP